MTAETAWARRQRRDRERAAYIAEHGNRCELCGAGLGEKGLCGAARKEALNEDHGHAAGHGRSDGAHRGWICGRANRALLGWMTPEWLRATADYLERAA